MTTEETLKWLEEQLFGSSAGKEGAKCILFWEIWVDLKAAILEKEKEVE